MNNNLSLQEVFGKPELEDIKKKLRDIYRDAYTRQTDGSLYWGEVVSILAQTIMDIDRINGKTFK